MRSMYPVNFPQALHKSLEAWASQRLGQLDRTKSEGGGSKTVNKFVQPRNLDLERNQHDYRMSRFFNLIIVLSYTLAHDFKESVASSSSRR